MPFTENLLPFLQLGEFATAATYNGVSVVGIFDNPDAQYDLGRVGFEAPSYRYVMRAVDLPGNAQSGDLLVVAGVTYNVQAFQRDGTGLVELILRS